MEERWALDPDAGGSNPPPQAMNTRWFKIFATLWWDREDRSTGCPIEFNIHTEKKYYLIRPFARAQRYDWTHGIWTDEYRHIVSSPEHPEIWDILERHRLKLDSPF